MEYSHPFKKLKGTDFNHEINSTNFKQRRNSIIGDELLLINKRKISEFKETLLDCTVHKHILILHGPPGCGKTYLLDHVCKTLNLSQLIWDKLDSINDFYEFLSFGSKYSSLNDTNNSKIIIIENLPINLSNNLLSFHAILKKINKETSTPVIFSITDDTAIHSCFPRSLCNELNIVTVKLNPITKKKLSNYASSHYKIKDRIAVETFIENNDCDLRSLINWLTFHEGEYPKNKDVKDKFLSIFHCFGKIFHPKRHANLNDYNLLPYENSHLARNKLVLSIQEIESFIQDYLHIFQLGLFENYPLHIKTMQSIYHVANNFSYGHYMSCFWNEIDQSMFSQYSAILCCLYIVYFVSEFNPSSVSKTFQPFQFNQHSIAHSNFEKNRFNINNSAEFKNMNIAFDNYVEDCSYYVDRIKSSRKAVNFMEFNHDELMDLSDEIIDSSNDSDSDLFFGNLKTP